MDSHWCYTHPRAVLVDAVSEPPGNTATSEGTQAPDSRNPGVDQLLEEDETHLKQSSSKRFRTHHSLLLIIHQKPSWAMTVISTFSTSSIWITTNYFILFQPAVFHSWFQSSRSHHWQWNFPGSVDTSQVRCSRGRMARRGSEDCTSSSAWRDQVEQFSTVATDFAPA